MNVRGFDIVPQISDTMTYFFFVFSVWVISFTLSSTSLILLSAISGLPQAYTMNSSFLK